MQERFEVSMKPMQVSDETSTNAALDGAQIVLACGAAGIELVPEHLWKDNPSIEMLSDANATPPLGFGGIDMMDKGVERHGKLVYGAIGVGTLKLALHRACIGQLFEAADQVLDAEEIYAQAKKMA